MRLPYLSLIGVALFCLFCNGAKISSEPVSSVFEAFGHYRACIANALTSCEFSSKKDFSVDVADSISTIKSLLQEMKSERRNEVKDSGVVVKDNFGNGTYSLSDFRKILLEVMSEREGETKKSQDLGRNFENITYFLTDIKEILQEVKLNDAVWSNLENITHSLSKLETTLQEESGDRRKYSRPLESSKSSLAEVQTTTLNAERDPREARNTPRPYVACNCKDTGGTAFASKGWKIRNCEDIRQFDVNSTSTNSTSGIRTMFPYAHLPDKPITAYCDQDTDGGGWTVIQNRDALEERENFLRTWKEYVRGFGDLNGEFWLGLDHIHALTTSSKMELRVDLEDWEGKKKWAKYSLFHVGHPWSKFTLTISGYSGDAGDSMWNTGNAPVANMDGMKFSTFDQDNDLLAGNCAQAYRGAWWYRSCHWANLNGFQYVGTTTPYEGIIWHTFRTVNYSLKKASMKVRPVKV